MIRTLDLILASILLLIVSPLFIAVVICNRFSGEGEIFYTQTRVGAGGKEFQVFKFATMKKNSPSTGAGLFVVDGDERVLPFGNILRYTKINELPQLVNVILGDMSLVGWRPLVPQTYAKVYQLNGKRHFYSRPGITGIASLFFRNEETLLRSRSQMEAHYYKIILPRKLNLDMWWERNKGVKTYFVILALTFFIIVKPSMTIPVSWFDNLPDTKSNFD